MNLEEQFLGAMFPEEHVVLGQQLCRYSVGMDLLFRRIGLSFVSGRIALRQVVPHLLLGVFLCAHESYAAARQALEHPNLKDTLRVWRKKLGKFNEIEEAVRFKGFLDFHCSLPKYRTVVKGTGGRGLKPGAPLPAVLLSFLLGDCHLSREEAMEFGQLEAMWLYLTWCERQGGILLTTEEHVNERELLKAEAAKRGWRLMTRKDFGL